MSYLRKSKIATDSDVVVSDVQLCEDCDIHSYEVKEAVI